MKPRRVIVTLEFETLIPFSEVRLFEWWHKLLEPWAQVFQVQSNVIREPKSPVMYVETDRHREMREKPKKGRRR